MDRIGEGDILEIQGVTQEKGKDIQKIVGVHPKKISQEVLQKREKVEKIITVAQQRSLVGAYRKTMIKIRYKENKSDYLNLR